MPHHGVAHVMARMRRRFDRHQLCLSHVNRVAVLYAGGKAHVAVSPHDFALGSDDVQVGEEVAQDPVAPCTMTALVAGILNTQMMMLCVLLWLQVPA